MQGVRADRHSRYGCPSLIERGGIMKKIVIALGGNALGDTLPEQMKNVKKTVKVIADLIEDGNTIILSHGNGPQVGMINTAMGELNKTQPDMPVVPMSVCDAMSQGYIGYDLQNALREELLDRGITKGVCTLITQVIVDRGDPAFKSPSKPIGRFMTKDEADELVRLGYTVCEDSGRGYRRTIPSPMPKEIVELDVIKTLVNSGAVVIAAGGGGIPVAREGGNHLRGVGAVIDKDFASCLMAKELDADCLVILTAVENVSVNFNKPNQKELRDVTVSEMEKYIAEGHFAPGSMLPKVEAAVDFAKSKNGRTAIITHLNTARDGINGKTGTRITL